MITLPNGYTMQTTFFEDFSIADEFGEEAIRDTWKNAFQAWKHNHVYLTELAIVMSNESCWWWDKNKEISILYAELYRKTDAYCMEKLKGAELAFYINATD